jgi:oligopeptide/dipeptide ABC transporter ATP-binding protein
MIFQDPFSSLNPRMTVRDIITEGLLVHGLLQGSRDDEAARLLAEVGLGKEAAFRYPHEFSGGQRQRISIARAISLRPEFIVCDEAVSALDVSVQAQIINLLMDLSERHHLAYLFISHDLRVVRHISQRVAVMYLGQVMELGPTKTVIDQPKHPYSEALLSAVPVPGVEKRQRIVLQGDIPSPSRPPPCCRFHTRCPLAYTRCREQIPELHTLADRQVRCHLFDPAGK